MSVCTYLYHYIELDPFHPSVIYSAPSASFSSYGGTVTNRVGIYVTNGRFFGFRGRSIIFEFSLRNIQKWKRSDSYRFLTKRNRKRNLKIILLIRTFVKKGEKRQQR